MYKLLFIVLLSFSFSNIIFIPDDFSTIQEGIDVSITGDSVIVSDGEYFENLNIDKEITLGSHFILNGDTTHRDNTIINGSNVLDDSVFGSCLFITGEDIFPIVQGFTFTGGKGTLTNEESTYKRRGGGVTVYQSNASVTYNRFIDNGNLETNAINVGGAASMIGTGIGVGREAPRDITRDWVLDFSNNIFENNNSELGNTFESIGFDGEINFQGATFDVFSSEYMDVSEYWIVKDEATTNYNGAIGIIEAITYDVWVSPDGTDESNISGAEEDPFKTIDYALSRVYGTTSEPITVNLTEGIFSPTTTGEMFPIIMISYVNLIGQGEEATIIDAEQTNRVIYFDKCAYNNISALTITGGNSLNGGGIYMKASNPNFNHVTISENAADENGGGIYIEYSEPYFSHVIITENNSIDGGGVYVNNLSNAEFNYVIISQNNGDNGAGIYIGANSNPNLNHVMIINNTSNVRGGGMSIFISNPILMHMTISGNTAPTGGGIFLFSSNSTITNSIVWDNSSESIYSNLGTPSITYSDIEGGWEGEGNIDQTPLFNEDYTLMDGSPCIDNGDPNIWYSDIDGTRADMGATGGLYALPNFISYDFGEVGDFGNEKQFTLYNYRQTPITIESINFSTSSFATNISFPFIIEHLQTGIINIEVNNSSYGFIQDEMEFVSPDLPEGISVSLSVTGAEGNILTGNLSGTYPADTYIISGDLTIANGDVVILEAGTQFLFDGQYHFDVFGELNAIGTETDSIIFDNFGMDNWKGFTLTGVTNETIFEYVRISGAIKDSNDIAGGGGLRLYVSDPTLNHVTISGNYANATLEEDTGNGGGMYLFESSPILTNVIIKGNHATYSGGGICMSDNCDPILNHVTIIENTAETGGGTYIRDNSNPVFNYVTISENIATGGINIGYGGGIYAQYCNPVFNNIIVNGNTGVRGGGMQLFKSNFILTDSFISGNIANCGNDGECGNVDGVGGGIDLWECSSPIFNNVTISDNTSYFGGGMFVGCFDYNGIFNLNITNSSIVDNFSLFGGGILTMNYNLTLTNVNITNNACDCSDIEFYFNSLWPYCPDNGCGGGIFSDGDGELTDYGHNGVSNVILNNSIMWENSPDPFYFWQNDICPECEVTTINYSDIEGGWEGEGNIDADPLFTNIDSSNYTLQEGSPCIDAGIADLDGDGVEDITDYYGLSPDMGSFEWIPDTLNIEDLSRPLEYTLHPAYPNPFNPITIITYSIPEPTDITIRVYDILGKQVAELINDYIPLGNHQVRWNAENISTGVYFIKMSTHTFTQTQKVLLVK